MYSRNCKFLFCHFPPLFNLWPLFLYTKQQELNWFQLHPVTINNCLTQLWLRKQRKSSDNKNRQKPFLSLSLFFSLTYTNFLSISVPCHNELIFHLSFATHSSVWMEHVDGKMCLLLARKTFVSFVLLFALSIKCDGKSTFSDSWNYRRAKALRMQWASSVDAGAARRKFY